MLKLVQRSIIALLSQRGDHKPVQGFTFTPASLCYRDTCCDVVFLCLSVCYKSMFYQNVWTDRAVFVMLASYEVY